MNPTNSEWMKVMLDEIARKKAEAEQDQIEFDRRLAEQQAAGPDAAVRGGRQA
jgi:hypothetical protein